MVFVTFSELAYKEQQSHASTEFDVSFQELPQILEVLGFPCKGD